MLDDFVAPPTKPEPLGEIPSAEETIAFNAAFEKHQEFTQSDMEVEHFTVSTIPDPLLIKTINCPIARSLWKTEVPTCDPAARVFLYR